MSALTDLTEKAQRFMHTAEYALSAGDYDSCASRGYYAMFTMAEAVLLTKRVTGSSHRGVISLFGEHFVKTDVFEKHLETPSIVLTARGSSGITGWIGALPKKKPRTCWRRLRISLGKQKSILIGGQSRSEKRDRTNSDVWE